MPPRRNPNTSVAQEALRKHGAETRLTQPQPNKIMNQHEPNTSTRLHMHHTDSTKTWSDKSYEGAPQKRMVKPVTEKITSQPHHQSDSSDDDSVTDEDISDTEESSVGDTDLEAPLNKCPRLELNTGSMTIAVSGMPMPEYTIEDDILHYIENMKIYLRSQQHLAQGHQAQIIKAGIKGEARDVLMGYADKDMNTTQKIFKVLKQEFKKCEKSARSLHQLKQEANEKVSIFAGRIRRYVRNLGVKGHKIDRNCIEFMKIGALPQIQSRLYQRNPRTFMRAIKIAMEAEADKPVKGKPRIEIVNNTEKTSNDNSALQNSIKELCYVIQNLAPRAEGTSANRTTSREYTNTRMGNGEKGACFVCNKKGHRYMQCFKATQLEKQKLDELEARRANRRNQWQVKNNNSLNLMEATSSPQELHH